MILSDGDIRHWMEHRALSITPTPEDHQFQPCSVDVRLSNKYMPVSVRDGYAVAKSVLDTRNSVKLVEKTFTESIDYLTDPFLDLHPGDFVLGSTVERFSIPASLCARVEGRSSMGRIGVAVHVTAGFIDPGFQGNITLEIVNLSQRVIRLYAGMRVAQVVFEVLSHPAERPYGHPGLKSRYQNQGETPVASKIGEDNEG